MSDPAEHWVCPWCGESLAWSAVEVYSGEAYWDLSPSWGGVNPGPRAVEFHGEPVSVEAAVCPRSECGKESLHISYQPAPNEADANPKRKQHWVEPPGPGTELPECVPYRMRSDFKEACLVLRTSPKASAALSRRCLQGMIRDFHGVHKGTLLKEIDALKEKDVDEAILEALHGVRLVGNDACHPTKAGEEGVSDLELYEVKPGEAATLISLLELLAQDWYVARENREKLVADAAKLRPQKAK